jgi:hypothetical protein
MPQPILLSLLCMLLSGCALSSTDGEEESREIIAEVYQRKLYLDELLYMLHEHATPEDSVLLINAYTQRWVRDQIMLHKAEQSIPTDLNVEKLVQDYRASLVLDNYERMLIETMLDSAIRERELIDFYEANKEQYLLENPIARFHFLKMPRKGPQIERVFTWWNNRNQSNIKRLRRYAREHNLPHVLEDSLWMPLEDIVAMATPSVTSVRTLTPGKEIRYQDADYHYLLEVIEVKSTLEVAPLSYIRDQAVRAILHRRKFLLLDQVKDSLYEKEIRSPSVKVYTR